jgi:hypothetical protein
MCIYIETNEPHNAERRVVVAFLRVCKPRSRHDRLLDTTARLTYRSIRSDLLTRWRWHAGSQTLQRVGCWSDINPEAWRRPNCCSPRIPISTLLYPDSTTAAVLSSRRPTLDQRRIGLRVPPQQDQWGLASLHAWRRSRSTPFRRLGIPWERWPRCPTRTSRGRRANSANGHVPHGSLRRSRRHRRAQLDRLGEARKRSATKVREKCDGPGKGTIAVAQTFSTLSARRRAPGKPAPGTRGRPMVSATGPSRPAARGNRWLGADCCRRSANTGQPRQ